MVIALININNAKNNKPIIENPRVLLVGDYHMQAALNPENWNNATNLAQSAEPYFLSYWKLKEILKHNKVDTVFLSASYHNFSGFNDFKLSNPKWSSEMFKRSYLIENYKELDNIEIDYSAYFRVLWKQFCIYPHGNHIFYFGNYKKHTTSTFDKVDLTINRHFYLNKIELETSQISTEYFIRTVELLKENNVTLIVISPPIHQVYQEKVPQKFKQNFYSVLSAMRAKGVIVLDYTNLKLKDDFYKDGDHVNFKGADTLSKLIHKDLSN